MEEKKPSSSAPLSTIEELNTPSNSSRLPYVIAFLIFAVVLGGIGIVILTNKETHQENKVYHIGILVGAKAFTPMIGSFKKNLASMGYIEGKNVTYDTTLLENDPDSERKTLQRFVQNKVDLIFTLPTRAAEEAKEATNSIPIIFGAGGIEGTKLIGSIAHPGGNITGIRIYSPDNTVKRLEILHEIVPNAKKIYVIHSDYNTIPANLDAIQKAALRLHVTLIEEKVTSVADIKTKLDKRVQSGGLGIDALFILPEALLTSPESIKIIGDFSVKYKIPVTTTFQVPGFENILFGYNLNFEELGADSANLADKVLKGTPAGSIPVMSPNPELWINYKRANTLGLTVSEDILNNATTIIR